MKLGLTEEQVDLLAKLEQTGLVVTEAEVNDEVKPEEVTEEDAKAAEESINKLYNEVVDQLNDKHQNEKQGGEQYEEITLECSACNVILSIDQVIINTLEPERQLATNSINNLYTLAKIRDMYMRY